MSGSIKKIIKKIPFVGSYVKKVQTEKKEEEQKQKLEKKRLELQKEQERDDPLHETAMENLLNTLLLTIMRSTQVSPKPETQSRMAKVISYIEKNYQHELRLQDIAAEFYVSEYYLCHEFKKYTNALRILHAKRLITESDLNFTKIAEQTGFSSLTHFNRTFKSVVGTSPSAYRKANPKHE